ncbi:MAG: PLP-dependent aminotransferase family protein [Solobacterium sp.]|nr:PLP-dependent aminotransferase family protein [Solobacterium sp.]
MRYPIDESRKEPVYEQLYTFIREDIKSGVYPYGEKLPSKRVTSMETGYSLSTIEHTYDLLTDEGYIEPRERQGYFVIYQKDTLFASAHESTVVASPGSQDDAFPYSVFARTARRVLTDYGEAVMERSDPLGNTALKKAVVSYLARSRGIHIREDQVVIGSGAEYLYTLVVHMLKEEKIFAIEDPSYEKIRSIYLSNDLTLDYLKMDENGILSEELRRTRAGVLHVTPYHSYPSGSTADMEKRKEYIAWAKERDGIIVEDDYDSEFSVAAKPVVTLYALDSSRVIYMNTFTRTISPGMRVGYMILPDRNTELYRERISFCSNTVSTFSQLLLATLLNDGSFERHINRVRARRRRQNEDI